MSGMQRVRRVIASTALAALIGASIYAPLFHVHADHDDEAPLVHSHFPELEHSDNEDFVHMEAPDSHAKARSVDVMVTIANHVFHFDAVIGETSFAPMERQPSPGFVPAASPRAHAPPALEFLTPRAPPA
jgi:hypothetical protein